MTHESKGLINQMQMLYFLNFFFDIYDLSLFISFKAFLPSLRVLKTSQKREEKIKIVSVIKEIRVASILLVNLLKLFQGL